MTPSDRRAPSATDHRYRDLAAGYDASARFTAGIRARTIARLALRAGETVLDAGSGTGLSFAQLEAGVGAQGRVIGVESSAEMMALARRRVRAAGWANVVLLETPIERAPLPAGIDAFLFHYAHDILQSAAALEQLFRHARDGARVAVAGVKTYPWWLSALNWHVRATMRRYSANPVNLERPWALLERHVDRLERESTLLGRGYIAWGALAPRARAQRA